MNNVKKIAENILCNSLKRKISAPIPDEVELILDEDGNIETKSVEFENLEKFLVKLADDVDFSNVMSEDGIQRDVSMKIFINSPNNLVSSVNDVKSIAKDIEDEIDTHTVLDPYEFGSGFANLDVQTSDYSFDPSKNVARFKIEWVVSNAESGTREKRPY